MTDGLKLATGSEFYEQLRALVANLPASHVSKLVITVEVGKPVRLDVETVGLVYSTLIKTTERYLLVKEEK